MKSSKRHLRFFLSKGNGYGFRVLQMSVFLLFSLSSSCKNPYGTPKAADSQFGKKNDAVVDLLDDDGSMNGFGGGTHVGTIYSDDSLSLNATTNVSELDKSWTPKWNDLVAYWKFEEASWSGASGEIKDSIGQSHGVRFGEANTTSNAKIGSRAAEFDGVDDAIWFDDGDALEVPFPLTVSAWVNLNSLTEDPFIFRSDDFFCTGSNVYAGVALRVRAAGAIEVHLGDGGSCGSASRRSYQTSGASILINNWHHITVVIKGLNDISVFVDGDEISPGSYSGSGASLSYTGSGHGSIGINNNGGVETLNGRVDDLAMWKSALSAEDVALIYSRQAPRYAGTMYSRIIDSFSANTSWKGLKWRTPLPFGKELSSSNESSTHYAQLVGSTQSLNDDDLMEGILALWHFNEDGLGTAPMGSDFADATGNGFNATQSGGVTPGSRGKFFKAAEFDGVDDALTVNNLPLQGEGTISFWAKDGDLSSHDYLFDSTNGARYLLYHRVGSPSYGLFLGQTKIIDPGLNGLIDSNNWTHIVITYDLSHPSKKQIVYKNGVEFDSFNVSFIPKTPSEFYIGRRYSNSSHWTGKIDEFAVWSRSLSPKEVLQLYRRGANRVKIQVRTCAQSNCSDQEAIKAKGWKGPGGNEFTFFSEIYNNGSVSASCFVHMNCYASEFSLNGPVNFFSPDINFMDFGSNDISQDSKRYFQYRAVLESDDDEGACAGPCLPSLQSVEVKMNP